MSGLTLSLPRSSKPSILANCLGKVCWERTTFGVRRSFFSLAAGPDRGGRTAESGGNSSRNNQLRPALESRISLKTQEVYEVRLVHMNTWLCQSPRRFAHLQSALHVCSRRCTFAWARCSSAKRRVYVRSRMIICSGACSCAAARAYVHGRLFICRSLCTCAQPACLLANGRVCVQSVVLVCTRLYLCVGPCVYSHVVN